MPRIVRLVTLILLSKIAAFGQYEFIYQIQASGCSHHPRNRMQTGFRMVGTAGIVTALHGVADCADIKAFQTKQPHLSVRLTAIDADADAALLSAPGLGTSGLAAATNVDWETLGSVFVTGHPYGIGVIRTSLAVRRPALVILSHRLPDEVLVHMETRNSPAVSQQVLDLEGGTLLPGHSGAPILDSSNRVLAIASGGLREGFAQINWWRPAGGQSVRLNSLKAADPKVLFAMQGGRDDDDLTNLLKPGEELFDNTIFRMPAGHTSGKDGDGHLVISEGPYAPKIVIAQSEVLNGSFRSYFDTNLAATASRHGPVQSIRTREGFEVLIAHGEMVVKNQPTQISYVACNPGNRYEQILVVGYPGTPLDYREWLASFLESVDYASHRKDRQRGTVRH
jgi:hypothetical protein